ncbi:glycosyltransferase family 2 protein [Pyxidicoccus fallax]|uniref:Glycosyltransferase family 2 protein n=1 Tax=Pyxidicoccus fallax TaxID=394095 RepID=A0A848LFD9_9BACT|nr:glycosyltransferase family 2 protein [Pyxidicoccus fallax]NMO15031.1 glycosyltransferase family 2 protein [Pyxidicoccus fallax]NPC78053.1 glycosyltransferase family 2 protein [Pyxidicoccus fallax]
MYAWILLLPIGCICFFQLYYLVCSFKVRIHPRSIAALPSDDVEKVSILLPVFNSASTLDRCLSSILNNKLELLSNIVVVLDRCTDGSDTLARSFVERFAERGVQLRLLTLPEARSGKVAGLLLGGQHVASETVLLLDADIVLEPTGLEELVAFHRRCGEPFSSCLIFPFQEAGKEHNLTAHLICNNRLYRQGVLQTVKNLFGVGNFPGGIQMVNYRKYAELLVDGFLEDLTATYRVLSTDGRISILPRVLGYEVERQSLSGLFLQRVRWTLGAIEHLPTQVRTASTRTAWPQKILINSYHVMWEFQHYVIALGLLLAPFSWDAWPFFLMPLFLYSLQILRSAYLGRHHYANSLPGILFHCLGFPLIISAALVGSILMLVKKRSFFFKSALLFRRD